MENLEEVNTAAQQYLGQKEEEETQAVDLLLDVLIALLDKGSSDLRNLANLVFDIISPELTKSSLDLLSAVSFEIVFRSLKLIGNAAT